MYGNIIPDNDKSPEERLWWAVLLHFVRDYIEIAERASGEISRKGYVHRNTHAQIRLLDHHAASVWLAQVCEYVGWHQRTLIGNLERIKELRNVKNYEVEAP